MESELKKILETRYSVGHILSLEPIKEGVSNINYKVISESGVYIARICRYEPENQLRVMLPFLAFAEESNIPASRLVKTTDGELRVDLDGDPVVVSTFINGFTLNKEEVSEINIKELAENVAKLHGLKWQPEANSTTLHPSFILGIYEEWKKRIQTNKHLSEDFKSMLDADYGRFSGEAFLSKFNALPKHVVHGDLIPGNVMFTEDGSFAAFVDLEEIGRETRLLDISRIVTNWFYKSGKLNNDQVQNFMSVYKDIFPLSYEEEELRNDIVGYVTFRHAVFVTRMLLQGRLSSIEGNDEVAVYLKCRDEDIL